MNSARLLIHPFRSRIVTALIGRNLTTRELAKVLPDIPVPSLYRNVRVLLDAGVLRVADEVQVRGAMERKLELTGEGGRIDRSEVAQMDPSGRFEMLRNFLDMLGTSYRSYVEAGGEEPAKSLVTAVDLDPEEEREMLQRINEVVDVYRQRSSKGSRRLFAIVCQPDIEGENPSAGRL